MSATTVTTPSHRYLARNLRRHADNVDALADLVEDWGDNPSAHGALGLIEQGDLLRFEGWRLHDNDLIGRNTKVIFANDLSIALGGRHVNSQRGSIGYALMHSLYEVDQYGKPLNGTRSKAASIRVHASSARVVAQMAENVANGEYWNIG
jgi:hypothetical protein